jgi:hypothetical protein
VSEGAAAAKPKNLDWVEAASLPLVGLTAWQVLIDLGGLKPSQKVLIHAGAGGSRHLRHPARQAPGRDGDDYGPLSTRSIRSPPLPRQLAYVESGRAAGKVVVEAQ